MTHRRSVLQQVVAALGVSAMTIFFAACLSFGDLSGGTGNTGDASVAPGFTIGGTVAGLEGASVTLLDNGGDAITVSADGPFVFPAKLASGASYVVTVSSPPSGHICAVQNGVGAATADVTNIAVSCPSKSATLASLTLSNGTLSPAFSAAVLAYSANVSGLIFSPSTVVTAQAASPSAMIAIDGKPATAGTATVTVPIATTPRPIAIIVTAADGSSSATTNVTVQSGDDQTAYFKASNATEGRDFGTSVAISSDGSTLAIGAPSESSKGKGVNDIADEFDSSASAAGAVYIFAKSGGTWAQTAYVKASNTRTNSFFGASLSLNADGTVLAVGAIGESSVATGVNSAGPPNQSDTSAAYAGAVFIFANISGTWAQTAYVKPASTHAGNRFGNAVSLSASGTSLAVGSYLESSNAAVINGDATSTSLSSSGAAYLFENNGGWSQTTYFKPSNNGEGHRFGNALALSGDGSTLIVGAHTEPSAATGINNTSPGPGDSSAFNAGAAYVFAKSGSTWTQTTYVKASNTRANESFGDSVAVSSDGTTFAVGASAESSGATGVNNASPGQGDTSATGAGAVFVFEKSSGNWAQSAYVKASNTRSNALFGDAIALSGDGTRLAVGSPGESSGASGIDGDQTSTAATGAGAVYVFLKGPTSWAQTAYVKASNDRASAAFGGVCVMSTDGASLLVGASGESSATKGVNSTNPGQGDTSAPSAGAAYLFQ